MSSRLIGARGRGIWLSRIGWVLVTLGAGLLCATCVVGGWADSVTGSVAGGDAPPELAGSMGAAAGVLVLAGIGSHALSRLKRPSSRQRRRSQPEAESTPREGNQ